jgi:hypothetical protein
MLVIIRVLFINHLKPEVKIIFNNAVPPTSQTTQYISIIYTNQLMEFCEITNYCENHTKQILRKNAATVLRRLRTRVNDFGCSLYNNTQITMFNNIYPIITLQSITRQSANSLQPRVSILNDHLQQSTILKQWGSNEGFKIKKTRTHIMPCSNHTT